MYLRAAAKLAFLFSSTNQHGVHSPFVFKYITECLYSKPVIKANKTQDVLLKSISYFRIKSVALAKGTSEYAIVQHHYPEVLLNTPPVELAFLNLDSREHQNKPEMLNDTLLILDNIYANRTNREHWRQLIKSAEFTVSIDLFYCGVLFKRKEQHKEHFKVRI